MEYFSESRDGRLDESTVGCPLIPRALASLPKAGERGISHIADKLVHTAGRSSSRWKINSES